MQIPHQVMTLSQNGSLDARLVEVSPFPSDFGRALP
jgi:hypothetical protein